jgi:hypothetical protein
MSVMKRFFLMCAFLIVSVSMVADAATISGIVSDSTGSPLKTIAIALKATTTGTMTVARDTTDSTGAYSMTCDSTSGKYVVRTTDTTGTYILQYDTVALDGTDKTVNVKMAKIKRASVSGTVTDSAAATVLSGIVVRLSNGAVQKRDTTAADGKYAFDSVTSGATITVSATGFVTKTVIPTIGDAAVVADIALAKVKYSIVSGTVTDSAAAIALTGIVVRLSNGAIQKRDTTAADGKYSFDSVTSGATISVSAMGYVTKTVTPVIGPDSVVADVALAKVKYGSLVGTITDSATGTAITGAIVRSGNTKRDTTAADGKYALDSLMTGTATISVSVHGYASQTRTVGIGDSAHTVDFKLVAVSYGSIAGTITDSAAGTAIAGAIVTVALKNSMAAIPMMDTTGADGAYVITDVEFGTYTITASAEKHLMATDSVIVSDTARKTANLKLNAFVYFAVSGTVTDSATGKAVVGALVALRTGSTAVVASTIDSVLTDSTGHYAFDSAFGGGRIRVTATNYTLSRTDLTATTSAAQTIDIKIVQTPVAVKRVNSVKAQSTITVAADRLFFKSVDNAGSVRIMNTKGELMAVQTFAAGATVCMNLKDRLSAGTYIVKISRKNGALMQRILVR